MRVSKKPRSALFRKFSESTTCHGIVQIKNAENNWVKAMWVIVVVTVFSMLVWQIADRCSAYFSYKTSVQIKDVYVGGIPMPAITICNFNRWKDIRYRLCIIRHRMPTIDFHSYFNLSTDAELVAMDELSNALDSHYRNGSINYYQRNESIDYFNWVPANFSLRSYMISKGWNLVSNLNQNGVDLQTMFFCTLAKTTVCTHANFTPVLTNHLGMCYTLNVSASQHIPGRSHGFSVILDSYQTIYTENPLYGNWEGGIKFQVHAADEPPEVDRFGHAVGTGVWASASIRKLQVSNMHKPWGACDPDNEVLKYHPTYTLAACMKECYERIVTENCGCRGPPIIHPSNVQECTPHEVINCYAKELVHVETAMTPQNCNCAIPCNEVKYQTSLSYSTFPNVIAAKFAETTFNLSDNYLRNNVLGLSVFYNSMTVTKVEENKSITESALLSDIGGQLGLWIGISVVTLFELAQLIARFLRNEIISLRHPKTPVTEFNHNG